MINEKKAYSSLAEEILGSDYNHNMDWGYTCKTDFETCYLFESKAWKSLKDYGMKTAVLHESFRQTDRKFIALLDDLRSGTND